ncbi:hypothetical protein Sjap_023466 [Stephania japonica]|uniref:Uncharacterized protein n=1 Tax=Stephania japonica TaxID=461633 RepID=A0AAP0EBP6_9MAGN
MGSGAFVPNQLLGGTRFEKPGTYPCVSVRTSGRKTTKQGGRGWCAGFVYGRHTARAVQWLCRQSRAGRGRYIKRRFFFRRRRRSASRCCMARSSSSAQASFMDLSSHHSSASLSPQSEGRRERERVEREIEGDREIALRVLEAMKILLRVRIQRSAATIFGMSAIENILFVTVGVGLSSSTRSGKEKIGDYL